MGVFQKIYETEILNEDKKVAGEITNMKDLFYSLYKTTICNAFKYENLPDTKKKFLLEDYLFHSSSVAMFLDDNKKLTFAPCTPCGKLNRDGTYDHYRMVFRNGETYDRTYDEIEICYNNMLCYPSSIFAIQFAEKSAFALNAVDSALDRAIMPVLIECGNEEILKQVTALKTDKKLLQTFTTTLNSQFHNEIHVHKFFDNNADDVLSLWDTYVRYRNFFYTTFGVSNVEIQKTERLTKNESQSNEEITRYTLFNDMYLNRLDFSKRVKNTFNVDIGLEINRDANTVYNLNTTNSDKIESIELEVLKGVNLTGKETEKNENQDNK